MMKILIINGSVRGNEGNSYALSKRAEAYLTGLQTSGTILTLTDPKPTIREVYDLICRYNGFLVVTGVYWNNWSSPLQRFIEIVTTFENSPAFFGKPVACAVTMDSVGGIEVAGRIHAVFSGLGCWSPPCSTLVISRVGQEAIQASKEPANEDVWRTDDMEIVLKNLVRAASLKNDAWVSWPHIELKVPDQPWPEHGPLNLGTPEFITSPSQHHP
ncbi:NAD(P)H-dependent oxidoreductase [Chitinophaga niabensis]|uniref:NADPH-dependent FMN reductase n=1 Tax=Chitinophaga niabensis TaxID=536979 RepID=A0A1N6F0L0_9BACT|nr:NAD(P)H-dependent oxidoreductase [Chitinophaga niabensis]SIN88838.1 NADPH-dependent FMN reductase [Chitinophaga niabensis]